MKITRYELSGDRQGLLAYFINPDGKEIYYHIHSDELTPEQKIIRRKMK